MVQLVLALVLSVAARSTAGRDPNNFALGVVAGSPAIDLVMDYVDLVDCTNRLCTYYTSDPNLMRLGCFFCSQGRICCNVLTSRVHAVTRASTLQQPGFLDFVIKQVPPMTRGINN